jgi:DNA-directed RNA polymerase specialized sigma24 family protein
MTMINPDFPLPASLGREHPIDPAVAALLRQVRASDGHAIQELCRRYLDRLTALVRRRLAGKLPQAVPLGLSAQDVARSAFNRFIERVRHGSYQAVQDEGHLWNILAQFVRYRTREVIRHVYRGEGQRRWKPLPDRDDDGKTIGPDGDIAVPGTVPVEVQLRRLVDALAGNKNALHTLELLLEGRSVSEIATALGRSQRSIELYIRAIKAKVKEICA